VTARLLLDEMYPPALAGALRNRGHDVTAVAGDPELTGADDRTILTAATRDARCLVTENVRDFAVLARHTAHAGLLFVSAARWPRHRSGMPALIAALDKAISADAIPTPAPATSAPAGRELPPAGDIRWLT
jgi:hypothetical protein